MCAIKMGSDALLNVAGTLHIGAKTGSPEGQLIPGAGFGRRVGVEVNLFFHPDAPSLRQAPLIMKSDGEWADAQIIKQAAELRRQLPQFLGRGDNDQGAVRRQH